MPDFAKSKNYFPVEASIPDSKVSLESILCTEELRRRQSRLPDYNKENDALVALLGALLESHSNILQTLAETILDVTQCDSNAPRGAVFRFTLPVRDRRTLRPKKRRHGSHRQ